MIPTWLVSPSGSDVITRARVSGSLLHVVVKYTLHRLFEQHFYRIISELFSSGSVLCVCLLTLIFQRVSLHIENGQMKGNTVML